MDVMQPEFEDEQAINPFDFWQGANFKLKLQKKDGFWNYDKSEFDSSSPLLEDDDALEAIWKKQHSLTAFVAADQFKSHEVLRARLEAVLRGQFARKEDSDTVNEDNDRGSTRELVTPRASTTVKSADTVDEDDTLSYFAKLAEE